MMLAKNIKVLDNGNQIRELDLRQFEIKKNITPCEDCDLCIFEGARCKDKGFRCIQLLNEREYIVRELTETKISSNMDKNKVTFKDITEKMVAIQEAKNSDYGNSFEEMMKELGWRSGLAPIYAKFNRLKNLSKKGEENAHVNESLDDTILDMANYLIMLYAFRVNNE